VCAALLVLLRAPATAQKVPAERDLGVPMYPGATFVESFAQGPAARHLFGSNDITISVVRFYEARTGRKPQFIQGDDGMETYRFVLQGSPDAALPDLEVQVSHFPGGTTIPDARGETRRYSTTILITKRTPRGR
jgi:hypothetical protein